MLELFFKHLDFVGLVLERENEPCDKYEVKFTNSETQKHWLSFRAIYKKGHNDAVNKFGAYAVQEIIK